MEINLEIAVASLALVLSLISLYHQFFHKEIVVYPSMQNHKFFLNIENSGGSLVQNFTIEILNIETVISDCSNISEEFKVQFKNQNSLNGKALNTLASKGKRTILLGRSFHFRMNNRDAEVASYPIFSVKVRYKGLKRSKVFICDYNSYANEIMDQDISFELKELNSILRSRGERNL